MSERRIPWVGYMRFTAVISISMFIVVPDGWHGISDYALGWCAYWILW